MINHDHHMDKQCATAIGRLDRYLFRIKRALRNDELIIALSDSAELSEIARRLWHHIQQQIASQTDSPARDWKQPGGL
jgi:hypothetical protein